MELSQPMPAGNPRIKNRSCMKEYVHPWADNCKLQAPAGLELLAYDKGLHSTRLTTSQLIHHQCFLIQFILGYFLTYGNKCGRTKSIPPGNTRFLLVPAGQLSILGPVISLCVSVSFWVKLRDSKPPYIPMILCFLKSKRK